MATYKVPQDVEADDKLIGPFSFRQFIYLIIVVMAGVAAWGLAQLFIGLVIIPIPVMIFFGALALPLRKDQPMEIYMAAMVSYYLKPRKRLWDPEGVDTIIEITAPKTVEVSRVKDLSQNEAEQRLSYLANIVDTQGWAIRGTSAATPSTVMNNDIFVEADGATDILDTSTTVAQHFDQMMQQSTERLKEEARVKMMQPQPDQTPTQASPSTASPHYNPYPEFRQTVIQPLNDPSHMAENDIPMPVAQPIATVQPPQVTAPQSYAASRQTATPVTRTTQDEAVRTASPITPTSSNNSHDSSHKDRKKHDHQSQTSHHTDKHHKKENTTITSDSQLSAGIINLANNPDLSIETIAHEANRLHKKAEEESQEVIISLR